MSPIYKSGAFIQQCFAVHPLSMNVKLFTLPNIVGVLCQNCQIRHRITVQTISTFLGEESASEEDASISLSGCTNQHPEELRISGMNVVHDLMQLRCHECKKRYQLTISFVESHQK